ncbi:MAG: cell wall/surface repeat protein, partial [Verrucomicrobiaceae bacterium]|nr:cell wall/surface repeat protein [Verrucomicrobiaceae bacterium]
MSFSVRSVFFLPVFIAAAAFFSALPLARADIVGTDWTVRNPVRLHSDMLDMAVNGSSNLVAVGAHGAIVSGSDPSALARVPTGVTDDFSSVTFGGGRYYTVGNRGHILSSTNSTTWTVKYSSTTDIFESVATSGSLVVAAGAYFNSATASYNNVVVTSTDGVNWTRRVFPNMAPITRMLWNGQMFVGILDGATASSLDGSSWS